MRNWFGALKDMPEDFEDAKPDLMPVVRSRSHFELNSLRGEVESGTPISWPYQAFGEHFGTGMVYDLPSSMRSISQPNLDAWGVTFYEAMEVARENLSALPAKFVGPQSGEGAYLSATGDSYDASRLLLTDIIRQLKVNGDPVAMIPNRENLVVVGSEDAEGLSGMLKMATEALKQPRPISGIALRLDGDEWVPWLPDALHPLYKDFQQLLFPVARAGLRLSRRTCSTSCTKRRARTCSWRASPRSKPRTAGFSALRHGRKRRTRCCPRRTCWCSVGSAGRLRMVEWQKVTDVAGDLMEPLDIYPFRYRVREFPSEKQLAAMGNMLG